MGKAVGDPPAHSGDAGAHGEEAPIGRTLDVRMPVKEGWRHGARLVQVEIDSDAEPEGVLHQGVEPSQPFFPVLAEFRKLGGGGQGAQQGMHPDAVDAGPGQRFQVGSGEGVDILFQERISEERQVRVEVTRVPGCFAPEGPLGHKGSASKLHLVLNPVEALPDVFFLLTGDMQLPRAYLDFEASSGFGPGRADGHPNGFAAGGRGGGDLHPSSHGAAKVVLEASGDLGQPGLVRLHQVPAAA